MSKNKSIVSVKVIKGDINRALKKYKRKVNDSGHLMELRERKTYTKPKTIRRLQKQQAIREQQRQTLLEKIEDGDNSIRLSGRKRKKSTNTVKKTDNKPNLLQDFGLKGV